MERNRARIICLALLWCLTAVLFVEGRRFSQSSIKSETYQKNSKLQPHGRSLSAALHIERCAWMQDSSCQINPTYARVVLSNSTAFSDKDVLGAVFDEARCLSITHEAACSSRKKCEWAEREAGEMRSIQSHCQYKGSPPVWIECAVEGLRNLVKDYMVCRKRRGGSCNRDSSCELVKIRDNEEGCGLMANRVLDLIVESPASQTEIISTLVESTVALRETDVPDLEDLLASSSGSSTDDDYRRRLLDDDAMEDILAVDEGSDSGFSSSRSVISGTGTARGEEYEASSDNEGESNTNTTSSSSSEEESSSERSTSPKSSVSSANSTSNQANSNNKTVLAGSVSYIVSTNASSEGQEERGHDAHSTSSIDTIQARINDPVELAENIDHLKEVDSTISVSLSHVADAVDIIATLIEERPLSGGSQNLFKNVTRLLEIMRYRLDSQMDNEDEDQTWTDADKVWWRLQHTVQDLDILTSEETQVPNSTVQSLVEACETARSTWIDLEGSDAFSIVFAVEVRLKDSLQNGSSPDSQSESVSQEFASIGSLEEFVSNVVGIFNPTLVSLYPQQLNISFARKYEQLWVEVLAKRNKKWKDIKTLVSNQSNMGQQVTTMLKKLHLVKPVNVSDERNIDFLELRSLKSLVDEMVGALSASLETRYRIKRLPESLMSPGLTIWLEGPQVTADAFRAALPKDASQYSLPNRRNNTNLITSIDAMGRHLASLSVLIDAKLTKSRNSGVSRAHVERVPETTSILHSVESALKMLKKWNEFNASESDQKQNYYGTKTTTNFALSLAGCLVLAPDAKDQCRGLNGTRCSRTTLHYGNAPSGINTEAESPSICVPEGSEKKVEQLLQTPEQVSSKLAKPVADLFFTTAYCPARSKSECNESKQCSLHKRLDGEAVCRPSSDIVSYHVEANNIITLAAKEESCRSYLGFPICSDLTTEEACNDGDSCLWIGAPHGEDTASKSVGICMTDWVQQLFQLNSTTLNNSVGFHDDVSNCQSLKGEDSCGTYGLEGAETNGRSQTSLPESSSSVRRWIVSCLTVVVTILFLMVVCISCKIHKSRQTPAKLIRSKKGRPKKTKTEAAPPKLPPFPMYSHVFEMSPFGSPSRKKNVAFPYDVSALENAETGSQSSRLRVPLQQDSRMERYTSATTAEISEIQPISEVEEIQPVSESENEDSEEGWSSSDGWSEDSDEDSENGSGSPDQNASPTGV